MTPDKSIVDKIEAEAIDIFPMYPIGKIISWAFHIEAKREAYKAGRLKSIEIEKQKDERIKELEQLITIMYNRHIRFAEDASDADREDNWQKFKKQNNF